MHTIAHFFISIEKYLHDHPEKGGLIGFAGLGFSLIDVLTPILQFTTASAACIVAITSAYFSIRKLLHSFKKPNDTP